MANYVDYDYWVKGYGEGDLDQPDFYVVQGYWEAGYAEYEDVGSVASVTATATVTAKAVDFVFGSASITGTATVTATPPVDPYVVKGYWVGGYCEFDDIEPSVFITAEAVFIAAGIGIKNASGAFTGLGTLEVSVTPVEVGSAAVTASGAVSAAANFITNGIASVTGLGTVTAIGGLITEATASVNGLATVDAIGDIIGYEWEDVVPSTDTWTLESVGSNTWTNVSAGSTDWVRQ